MCILNWPVDCTRFYNQIVWSQVPPRTGIIFIFHQSTMKCARDKIIHLDHPTTIWLIRTVQIGRPTLKSSSFNVAANSSQSQQRCYTCEWTLFCESTLFCVYYCNFFLVTISLMNVYFKIVISFFFSANASMPHGVSARVISHCVNKLETWTQRKKKKKHRGTLTLCHFFLTLKQNTSTFISHRSQQNMRLDVMTNAMKSSKSTKKKWLQFTKPRTLCTRFSAWYKKR